MTRIQALAILTVLSATIFISCGKDAPPDNSNPANTDNVFLDKMYSVNSSGDTDVVVFRYDNLKRLVSVTEDVNTGIHFNAYYYYNSTDSLPYKSSTGYNDVTTASDSEIVYHYYDASQRKLKDSMIKFFWNGYQVRVDNYSYAPGKMIGEGYIMGMVPVVTAPIYTRDTAILDANGNIISNHNYELNGSPDYELKHTANFTYDNHVNPFSKLNVWESFNRFPDGNTTFFEIRCHNNLLTLYEDTPMVGGGYYNFSCIYTYDHNDLPATVTTGASGQVTDIYTYKSL